MLQLRGLGDSFFPGVDTLNNQQAQIAYVYRNGQTTTPGTATTKPPVQDLTWCPMYPNDPGCSTYLATAPGQKVPGTNTVKPPASAACGGKGCPALPTSVPTAGTQINPLNPYGAAVSPPFLTFSPGWMTSIWGLALLGGLGYGAYRLFK
jgi:hypothetical protein